MSQSQASNPPSTASLHTSPGDVLDALSDKRDVVGVILAAGKGSRMGMPKALLTWRGQTFIDHLINTQYAAGIHHMVVITFEQDGPLHVANSDESHDTRVASAHPLPRAHFSPSTLGSHIPQTSATSHTNPAHHKALVDIITAPSRVPQLHSLVAAIEHLHATLAPNASPALLVGPVDQGPYPPALVAALLDGFDAASERVRIPTYQGQPGHPVLIGGGFVPHITLDHPQGLRGIFLAHPSQLDEVPLTFPAITRNLNTRIQYDKFIEEHA